MINIVINLEKLGGVNISPKFSLDRVHLTLLDFTSPNHLSNRYQCYKLKGIEYIDINMNLSLDLTLKKIKQ